MSEISITSRDLLYGINVDDVFWVKNAIINREQVRESKDEEIIADIIATMLFDDIQGSSSAILDEYYCLKNETKRSIELDRKITILTPEQIHDNFIKVFDVLKSLLNAAGKSFNSLISSDRNFDKVPRYFEIIFLALYSLIIKENKTVSSQYDLLKSLDGITASIRLSQGGGNWSAKERERSINAAVGIMKSHFVDNSDDPANILWSTQLETILRQSKTEQTSFDFKISFYDLKKNIFNESVVDKIMKTLAAMANKGIDSVGYVIIGVADKKEDAFLLNNISSKYAPIEFNGFYITGVNYDIDMFGKSADEFYQYIVQAIMKTPIDNDYKNDILNNIKFLNYGNKMILLFKVRGLNKPAIYNDEYYQRLGANVSKIEPKDFISLINRFNKR